MRRQVPKRARTLTETQLRSFLEFVSTGEQAQRDRVMVLLSFRAGLRAAEIATLSWSSLLDSRGKLRHDYLTVVGKRSKLRQVPIHPELFSALHQLRQSSNNNRNLVRNSTVLNGVRGGAMTANYVTVYMWRLYRLAGVQGASSHSGRRTMITELARSANLHGCSIKDVQILAGHSQIETTNLYIEPSPALTRLIRSL